MNSFIQENFFPDVDTIYHYCSTDTFMNIIKKVGQYIGNAFVNIKDKINKSTKTNSEYNKNIEIKDEDNKSDFDKSVDDFIENINNQ